MTDFDEYNTLCSLCCVVRVNGRYVLKDGNMDNLETPPPSYAEAVLALSQYPGQPPPAAHIISEPHQFPPPTPQFPLSTVQPSAPAKHISSISNNRL